MLDKFGIALLDCNSGTNEVEAIHKQLVALYGTWCTGVEMSDALLAERRNPVDSLEPPQSACNSDDVLSVVSRYSSVPS